jgi:2-polyprenyl-3-methyl-5-hydroxy-6-metoxy-1,4-benzoquinol methylase
MYTQADIDKYKWFHGLNFGNGLRAKGRSNPENWSLYGALSFLENVPLRGARVLDIGTMDGLIAFIAEKEGATVVATDLYDRASMRKAREIFNSAVDYHPATSIEDLLERFGPASFDVVIMGGLLYHLVSPLRAILIARNLLKTGGVLILETVATEESEPIIHFNLGAPVMDEYTTYFVPSLEAVRSMIQFCCFHVLGSNKVRPTATDPKYVRGTVMARATDPDSAMATTPLMKVAQERASKSATDRILDEFNFAVLRGRPQTPMPFLSIKKSGDDVGIDKSSFRTRFAVQP